MPRPIFLFGEAEKGDFCTPQLCRTLPQLADIYGHPPAESLGLLYAIQALLYERELIYFRVKEEGFSVTDYMRGLKLLEKVAVDLQPSAVFLPGVGDGEIIEATSELCQKQQTLLVITHRDLYDYLTHPLG